MEKRNIYLLLSYTGSIVSNLIKRFSDLEYSHISIGIDDTFKTFYSFGRIMEWNPIIAGFVQEDVKDGVYTRFDNAKYALYKLEISQEQYSELIAELLYFEKNKKVFRYNFAGLLSAKAGISLDRSNAYFCSQFAARVFEKADIYKFDKKRGLISPMDFTEIPEINLISSGELNEFRKFQWNVTTEKKNGRILKYSKELISRIRNA